MVVINARLGQFKLRGGRQASLFQSEPKDNRFKGLIFPTSRVGEAEPDHFWKRNGEYLSSDGTPHAYDLVELTDPTPKYPAGFVDTPKG